MAASGVISITAQIMGSQDMAPGTSAEDKLSNTPPNRSLFQKVGGAVKGMLKFSGLAKLGLLGILSQSKLVTGIVGTVFRLLGALVDIMLAWLVPFLTKGINWLASIVRNVHSFLTNIGPVFKAAWTAVWDWLTGLASTVRQGFLDFLGAIVDTLGIQNTVSDTFFGEGVTTANPAISESVVDDWANGKNAGGNLISAEDKAGVEQDLEDAREALAGGEEDATEPEAEVPWYGQRESEYSRNDLTHQLSEENFDETMDIVEGGEDPIGDDDRDFWSWTEDIPMFTWEDIKSFFNPSPTSFTPADILYPNGPVAISGEDAMNEMMGATITGPPATTEEGLAAAGLAPNKAVAKERRSHMEPGGMWIDVSYYELQLLRDQINQMENLRSGT